MVASLGSHAPEGSIPFINGNSSTNAISAPLLITDVKTGSFARNQKFSFKDSLGLDAFAKAIIEKLSMS